MLEGIFVDGLIFSLMVIGILISYRILDIADLTCDGSVATGAAVATMAIVAGLPIFVALLLSSSQECLPAWLPPPSTIN